MHLFKNKLCIWSQHFARGYRWTICRQNEANIPTESHIGQELSKACQYIDTKRKKDKLPCNVTFIGLRRVTMAMMVVTRWRLIVSTRAFVGMVAFVDMVTVTWAAMTDGALAFMAIHCCAVCVWCAGLAEGNSYELRWPRRKLKSYKT